MSNQTTYHERAVRVLQSRMSSQNRVVGLNDRVGQRWRGVYAELQLRLLAIVRGQAFQNQGTKSRTSSTAKGMEDKEALEARAVVRKATHSVHHDIDHLFANGIMSTSILSIVSHRHSAYMPANQLTVARGVLLAIDQGLRVEQTPVCAGLDLVNDVGLQIHV